MKKILSILVLSLVAVSAFSQKTISQLNAQATQIRNESTPGGNTRDRIATMFEDTYKSSPNLLETYTNPSWIGSIAGSKITGSITVGTIPYANISSKPTTLSGYGITDGQPLNANLTTIAGLSASNDDFLQRKSGAWANRTVAQVKTDLGLTGTNSGDQTTSGTTNRISVSNGTTNPVIDISASYAGQMSIVTVGVITTGTWNGLPITTAYIGDNQVTLSKTVMNTNRLIGRTTVSSGVMEEITVGTGLSLSAGSLTISGSYVGQSSITTLGTIATGVWQGTSIGTAYGGNPAGGSTGDVLTKNSGTDYDYSWAPPAGGGGGTYTASNGLTMVGNDVQIGGTLAGDKQIDYTSAYRLTLKGQTRFLDAALYDAVNAEGVFIEDTQNSACGACIGFYRNTTSFTSGDDLGAMHWYARSTTNVQEKAGSIQMEIINRTNGTIQGQMMMNIRNGGSSTQEVFRFAPNPTSGGDLTLCRSCSPNAENVMGWVNSGTGNAAYGRITVSQDAALTRANSISITNMGTGTTTQGMFVQDGSSIDAGSGMSGGLAIGSLHASGNVRIYTNGSAAGNLKGTFDTNGLTLTRGTSAGVLRYLEASGSGTNVISWTVPALAGDLAFTHPNAYPAGNNYAWTFNTDGTSQFVALSGSGTVTSVQVAGGTTGLTFSGGPVTTTGTITMTGTLVPDNGGTGLTALGTAGQQLRVNGGGTALEYFTPFLSPATADGDLLVWDQTNNEWDALPVGADGEILTVVAGLPEWAAGGGGGGSGTVTSVSVATANGFAGSVATATTTPAITITTSVTGLLAGNGTAIAAANADYGDITAASGTSLTVDNAAITYAKFQNIAGLSVPGRSTNSSGIGADITGSAAGQVLRVNDAGNAIGFSLLPINYLGAATGALSIDNGNNNLALSFNALTSGNGLSILGNNTTASGGSQTLMFVDLYGANATSTQTSWASIIRNRHTGTGAVNKVLELVGSGGSTTQGLIIGATASAISQGAVITVSGGSTSNTALQLSSSGTIPTALYVSAGNVGLGIAAPTRKFVIDDATTNSTFSLNRSGTERLIMGIAGVTDGIVTGSVANDVVFRGSSGQKMIFTNDGTVSHMILSGGSLSLSSLVGTGNRLVVASSTGTLGSGMTIDASSILNVPTNAFTSGGLSIRNASTTTRGFNFNEGSGDIQTTSDGASDQSVYDASVVPNNTIIVLHVTIAQIKSDGSEGAGILLMSTWRKDNSGTLTKVGESEVHKDEDMAGTLTASTVNSGSFIQTRVDRSGTSGNFRYGSYIIPVVTHSY